jgi:signal peptidase I
MSFKSFKKDMLIGLPLVTIMAIFGSHLVAVPTDSMYPTINQGDIVFVQKNDVLGAYSELNPDDIKVGDIVVYEKELPEKSTDVNAKSKKTTQKSGLTTTSSKKSSSVEKNGSESENKEFIVHRVVKIHKSNGKKYLIVKGDHNTVSDDEKVEMEQVTGKAVVLNGNPLRISQIGHMIFAIKSLLKPIGL